VNVWPVCERFPCTREEFRGAWEDRFPYDFVKEQYQLAIATGQMASFNQELMLRISSDEERLVQESEIRWFERVTLLKNKHKFNFYITTDFATRGKQSNDFSVISVWAYNAQGDWFWVDGICLKQTMDKNIDELFRLVQMYKPQAVGIEIAGQQGAFIQWIQTEMMTRNVWFNFAQGKSGQPWIQPEMDKISRFNLVVPLFKAGKIYFPLEMKTSQIMGEFMQEIQLATLNGLKSKHDDCIDTISMLMYLKPWKPSEEAPPTPDPDGIWGFESSDDTGQSSMSSYIV
jgi:predicted phage terminase large subunit-like protein